MTGRYDCVCGHPTADHRLIADEENGRPVGSCVVCSCDNYIKKGEKTYKSKLSQ